MFRLTRAQVQPIGLDIGHDSVKLLQLEVVGESLAVVAAARAALPAEARLEGKAEPCARVAAAAGIVRDLLRSGGFRGRRIVAAVPRAIVHVKALRLPVMPAADLEGAVRLESRTQFPFDTADAHLRCLPLGEVRQGGEVLQEVAVLAVRNADADAYVEQLHGCGVIIDSLDVEPCALYRSVERFIRRREDEHDAHVLVDVGLRGCQVVVGKGRDISFFKTMGIGSSHMNEAVARKLGITEEEAGGLRRRLAETPDVATEDGSPVRQAVADATRSAHEELAREVSLCLRYHSVTFRGHRPSRVRLVGGGAGDPQLQAMLGSMLNIEVEVGRPLYSVDLARMKPADRRGPMSEWAVALGLALRRTTGRFGARDGRSRDANAPFAASEAEAPVVVPGPRAEVETAVAVDAPVIVAAAAAAIEPIAPAAAAGRAWPEEAQVRAPGRGGYVEAKSDIVGEILASMGAAADAGRAKVPLAPPPTPAPAVEKRARSAERPAPADDEAHEGILGLPMPTQAGGVMPRGMGPLVRRAKATMEVAGA